MNVGQSMPFTGPMIHVCAFRLSVWNYLIRSSGVLQVFPFRNILYKSRRTFCFPFLQTSAICIFLPCLLVTCMFFWSKQVFQMLCYFLYHLIIAFLQRKSTVGLVLVSVSTYFGSCFNSPKKNRGACLHFASL